MAPSPASLLPSHRQLSLLQTPPLTLLSGLLPRAIEARASSSSLSAGAIAGIVLSGLTLCTVLMTIILYFRQPRTHRSVPPPRPHSNLSFRCATRVTPTAAQFPSHHNAEVAERKISHPVPFSAASSPPSSNDELPLNPWNGQVAWPIKSVAHSSPTVTTPDPIHEQATEAKFMV
ncbi:uncharacterized protein BROUX77_004290 [Berkeleyomyces rouxiae]|uniref:uncharacterized protein n=1 Tax=Berkeleyomyces rouxiae TaxID=2035830 RepID=UPI003B7982C7